MQPPGPTSGFKGHEVHHSNHGVSIGLLMELLCNSDARQKMKSVSHEVPPSSIDSSLNWI